MREMGKPGEQLHDEVGAFAGQCGLDLLICVGPLGERIAKAAIAAGMPAKRVSKFADAEAAAAKIPQTIRNGDVVLVKASRTVHLEIVAKAIGERKKAQ